MYGIVLLAMMAGGESAPDFHGKGYPRHYGACFGACYGVGYTGWAGGYAGCDTCGGWGQPYCGYGPGGPAPHAGHIAQGGPVIQPNWPGYMGYGGCGGVQSPAYGYPLPALDTTRPQVVAPVAPVDAGKGKAGTGDGTEPKGTGVPKAGDEKKDKGGDVPKLEDKDGKESKDTGSIRSASPARVAFRLPEGATLFVDDVAVPSASQRREFRTPDLLPNEVYYYDLRAEITKDGKPFVAKRRVTVKAGERIEADFSTLGTETGVASADK